MNNLKDIGVNLSIDDYGTGFSSLSRLKDLPFNELKIDRSFVKEMTRDKGDEAIVRSTIELASQPRPERDRRGGRRQSHPGPLGRPRLPCSPGLLPGAAPACPGVRNLANCLHTSRGGTNI